MYNKCSDVVRQYSLLDSMAQVTRDMLVLMLQSNVTTVVEIVKSFVQIMFEGLQRKISDVNNYNFDLKQSLEFAQAKYLIYKTL